MVTLVETLVSAVMSIADAITIPSASGNPTSLLGFAFGCAVVAFSVKHLLP